MKTILEIGYCKFLLPASANVNAILKILSEAQPVEERHTGGEYKYLIGGEARVEVKLVKDSQVINPQKLKQLPEKASEDCNGKQMTIPD